MKIQIVSDLHIEQWGNEYGSRWWLETFLPRLQTDADVLVIAGDFVSTAYRERSWSRARFVELFPLYKHIVFVPGNHEFWGNSIIDGMDVLRDWNQTIAGLHLLEAGKVVTIDGQRFHGGTMWQPHSGSLWAASRKRFIDGRMISDFYEEAPALFDLLMKHLEAECRPGDIVVTHHSPSMDSLDPRWAGHPDNRFFLTPEAEPYMLRLKPALWIHGHVHSCWDYMKGSTRVIANPHGYPGEGVPFDPQLVVSV